MFNRGFRSIGVRSSTYLKGLSPNDAQLYGPAFSQPKVNYSKFSKESKIVCVGGPSIQSSILHAVKNSSFQDVNKIAIVGKRSWLCDVHSDWDDKPWGQCKRYLPEPMREIADDLYKDYPDDVLLNFGIMKNVVLELERRVQESGVSIIDREVLAFKETQDGLFATMKDGEELYLCDENYKIVNAANIPGAYLDLPNNNSGGLYHLSRQESTDTIAVIGSGANLTWNCRDFSQVRRLIHILPPNERLRPELNDKLYYKIRLDENSQIKTIGDELYIYGVDILSGEKVVANIPKNRVYSALGHKHNYDIVSRLDTKKVSNVDCGASNKSVLFRQSVSSFEKGYVAYDLRGTVVPPGNVKYNFLSILYEIGMFDPAMPNAVIAYENWQKEITKIAVAQDISIDPDFFSALQPLVKHMYSLQVPTPEMVMQVIKSQYAKSNCPAQKKDGTRLSADEFMSLLNGSEYTPENEENLSDDSSGKFKP